MRSSFANHVDTCDLAEEYPESLLLGSGAPWERHRKRWEYLVVFDAIFSAGMFSGKGIGFGVGKEAMPAWLAHRGCEVTATDLPLEKARGWAASGQHADCREELRKVNGFDFFETIRYEHVDMRDLSGIGGYDFCWSLGSLEHLGSIDLASKFVLDSIGTLRPGGLAVHTTEFCILDMAGRRPTRGGTVFFSKDDLFDLRDHLGDVSRRLEFNWSLGLHAFDYWVDHPPYTSGIHYKLYSEGCVVTSVCIVARRL